MTRGTRKAVNQIQMLCSKAGMMYEFFFFLHILLSSFVRIFLSPNLAYINIAYTPLYAQAEEKGDMSFLAEGEEDEDDDDSMGEGDEMMLEGAEGDDSGEEDEGEEKEEEEKVENKTDEVKAEEEKVEAEKEVAVPVDVKPKRPLASTRIFTPKDFER
jgi:hypothetical protein